MTGDRPEPIRVVAVIGAGEQGRDFALRSARAGFRTVLEDVLPTRLREARERLAGSGEVAHPELLSFASTVEEAVREADLAIDFVPDELESKLEIFSMIDRMAPPRTILCTPTRALSISDLAACTYRADRCVALHLPSTLNGTEVAVISGEASAPEVLDRVCNWLETLGYAANRTEDALHHA